MGKGKSLSFFERNLIAKKRAMGASARRIARDLFRSAPAIAKVIRGTGGNGAGRPRAITPRAERAFTQHVERGRVGLRRTEKRKRKRGNFMP